MDTKELKTFQLRVDNEAGQEWLAMIDGWRRKQPSPPSRAEAIRHLVRRGVELEKMESKAKRAA